jgi:outer membrane protein OmpA-like peptidoglycan-associated protein
MKLAKIAYLLAIGIALSLASTGCKKGLDKTTQIPGRGAGKVGGESTAPPITSTTDTLPPIVTNPNPLGNNAGGNNNNTTSTTLPPKTESDGFSATDLDTSNWTPDATVFKDQTVLFDFDKSVIKASEVPKLEEVARRMKADFSGPNKALRIEGHCDERGTEEYNRSLGDRRALSIREWLITKGGLDAKHLPTISYGEERPVDLSHNEAAWSKNRRGELILLTRPGSN